MKKNQKKEFEENRTSWKWFDRIYGNKHSIGFQAGVVEPFLARLLIEILKELQYMNDKNCKH
jgi:hypothetical protein